MVHKPPELLLGIEVYGCSLDVWAIGCIVAEMIDFQPLFAGDSEIGSSTRFSSGWALLTLTRQSIGLRRL